MVAGHVLGHCTVCSFCSLKLFKLIYIAAISLLVQRWHGSGNSGYSCIILVTGIEVFPIGTMFVFTTGWVLGNKSNKSVCSSNKRENQICADAKSRVESNKPLPFCVINTRGYFSGEGRDGDGEQ